MQAILQKSGRTLSSEQLVAQLDELTRDLDADSAGQILYQLADQYYHSGRWPAAADTFQALVDRYPQHSPTPPALCWLAQYYCSAEAAWRVQHDARSNRNGSSGRRRSAVRSSGPASISSPSRRCDFRWPRPIAAWVRPGKPSDSISCKGKTMDTTAGASVAERIEATRSQEPAAEADLGMWRGPKSGRISTGCSTIPFARGQAGLAAKRRARRRRLAGRSSFRLRRRVSLHRRTLPRSTRGGRK